MLPIYHRDVRPGRSADVADDRRDVEVFAHQGFGENEGTDETRGAMMAMRMRLASTRQET
jgi:hypothetical protein